MTGERRGFTVIELLVAIVLGILIMGVVWRLSQSLSRGATQGREVSEQVRVAAMVVRALSDDVRLLVPWPIKSSRGVVGMQITAETPSGGSEVCFAIRSGTKVGRVRYRFDPARREILRIEEDPTGAALRENRLGMGQIEGFQLEFRGHDIDDVKLSMSVSGNTTQSGKARPLDVVQVFPRGYLNATETHRWVFWEAP